MELFFRKYFWTVNLLFILLVALLAARTVNLFVESSISPAPSAEASPRVAQRTHTTDTVLASIDAERLSRVTGVKLPEPEVAVKEPTTPEFDANAPPAKSGLRVKLLGTLVAGNADWSFASIQDMTTQRSQTYMIGNTLMGATVMEIERERVIINNGGRKEFIDGQPGDGAVAAYTPPPVAAPTATASNGLGNGIKSTGENEYEVPKAEIDKTLSNLNDVAMQARIVPAFKDGQSVGFKLFSIRPDSIYSKIGVQNGDVIRRINGFDMNSPEKALEVYSKLKDSSRIEIEIERNGAPIRKSYNVR
ncbi:type II secretion system protein GspC [Corallococcus llansteffanensis]|uniref:General secretion pathway protein GspC n=1 Tax=Corallococcus llansteffanensis TaxID=2316731 RepID=A0A3A8Q1G1_9BACT|nr:type II secretion system protein GspC [Corallococcus llansteffanensis]RKH59895.1 general secretion pathway protein GspC [Corallococcus llansteffanensis]